MEVLIIGASGYVGSCLYNRLSQSHEVSGTCFKYKSIRRDTDLIPLNLVNPRDISKVLQRIEPEIIVHTGGLTSVDYCERKKDEAMIVNVEATRHILNSFDGKLIYFSTNYVFDGSKGNYIESDSPNPINHYGLTKFLAESLVLRRAGNLVIRFGSIYGYNPENNKFFDRFLENGRPKEKIRGCPELILSPTYLGNIVDNLESFLGHTGIIHFVSDSPISEYDFFAKIIKGLNLRCVVETVPFEEICRIAKRPRNASILSKRDLSMIRTPLDVYLKTLHDFLQKVES